MARVCEVCGRGTVTANSVPFSHKKTKTTQKINLQSKKIDGKRVKICTSCIKGLSRKADSATK